MGPVLKETPILLLNARRGEMTSPAPQEQENHKSVFVPGFGNVYTYIDQIRDIKLAPVILIASGALSMTTGEFRSHLLMVVLTLSFVFPGSTFAQKPEAKPEAWVQQLGDDSFQKREQAQEQLSQLGKPALAALNEGLKSPNPEIRSRCSRLVALVTRDEHEKRLRFFISRGLKPGEKTFEGWDRYQKLVGSDYQARALFVEIYRTDPDILKLAQKSPKNAFDQFMNRSQSLQRRGYTRPNARADKAITAGEVGALLYLTKCKSGKLDRNQFNYLYNALTRPNVVEAATGEAQISELIVDALKSQGFNSSSFYQWTYLIQRYQLVGLAESTLRPEIEKKLAAALKDPNQVSQLRSLVSQVNMLGFKDLMENQIKPGARLLAEKVADKPNLNQLYSLVSMAQQLGLQKTMQEVLKPAYLSILPGEVKKGTRLSYQISYLTQALGAQKEAAGLLWPAVMKRMLATVNKPNENEINRLLNDARYIGKLTEAQAILRPAAITVLQQALEKANDFNALQRAYYLSSRFGTRVMEEDIRARVSEIMKGLGKGRFDPNQTRQLYYLAQNLGMQKDINETLKPVVAKAIEKELASGKNKQSTSQLLSLAENMQLKEALPLAVLVGSGKKFSGYERARALHLVGRFGTKENVKDLEKLVKDSTAVTTVSINGTRITTQIRDVALATMIHLSGKSIIKYKFDYSARYNQEYLNTPFSYLGFGSDKARQEALKKWNARSDS